MARGSRFRWMVGVLATVVTTASWWAFNAADAGASPAVLPAPRLPVVDPGGPLWAALPTGTQIPTGWRYQGPASGTVEPGAARRAVASCAPGDLTGLPRIVYASSSTLRESAEAIYVSATGDPALGSPMTFVSLWRFNSARSAATVMSSERRFEQRCSRVTFAASVKQEPAQPVTFLRRRVASPHLAGATDVLTMRTVSLNPAFRVSSTVTMFRVGPVVAYVAGPQDAGVTLAGAVTQNLQPLKDM